MRGKCNVKKTLSLIGLLIVITMFGAMLTGCSSKPAAESKEIKIGANFELTGGISNFGKQTLNGIELAFKEANAAGGVLGKKLVLITADNKSEPSGSYECNHQTYYTR